MNLTALNLAAEIKRQIDSKLSSTLSVFGGMNHFSVYASIQTDLSPDICLDAIGILMQQLAGEHPDYSIEIEGESDGLTVTFSK